MDAQYLNAELERLAAGGTPEFGPNVKPWYDQDQGDLRISGSMIIDDDYYKWEYRHPNVFQAGVKPQWTVTAQNGSKASDDIRRSSWNSFVKDMLPNVIKDMSKKYQFPRKYLETIPGFKNYFDMYKTSPLPDLPKERLQSLIKWDNWVKKPGINSREGVFTYIDPLTKKEYAYRFRYEEHYESLPNGNWHYTKVKCSWVDRPSKIPKRVREDYMRIIQGEVARQATEEAEKKGIIEPEEGQEPRETEAPPVPEEEKQEAPTEFGGIRVVFTGDWKYNQNDKTMYITGQAGDQKFTVDIFVPGGGDQGQARYDSPTQTNIAVGLPGIAESEEDKRDQYTDAIRKAVMENVKSSSGGGEQGAAA